MLRIFINSFFPSPFGETALKTSIPRSPRLAATVKKAKAGDCVLVTEPEVSVPVRLDCPRLEYDPVAWLLPATTRRSKLSVNPSSPETERLILLRSNFPPPNTSSQYLLVENLANSASPV